MRERGKEEEREEGKAHLYNRVSEILLALIRLNFVRMKMRIRMIELILVRFNVSTSKCLCSCGLKFS